jgi:hypothetical protein
VDQPGPRWLAELRRRCLERGVFCSLDELTRALEEWIKLWNEDARPFTWTRTPDLFAGHGAGHAVFGRARAYDLDTKGRAWAWGPSQFDGVDGSGRGDAEPESLG